MAGTGEGFLHRPNAVVTLAAGVIAIITGVIVIVQTTRNDDPAPPITPSTAQNEPVVEKNQPDSAQAIVEKCIAVHGLEQARQRVDVKEGRTLFRECSWPAPARADGDGFSEITVVDRDGPGSSEAEGMTTAQVFNTSCQDLEVIYQFDSMGNFVADSPIRLAKGEIRRVENGAMWTLTADQVSLFVLDPDESMILGNLRYRLDSARCI